MTAATAPSNYGRRAPASRITGIAVVVVLHVLVGYVLVSGMARKGLDLVKKPLEAVLIQEVVIPPPPPPMPPPPPQKVDLPKEPPKVQAPPPPSVPLPDVAPPVASAAPVIAAMPTPPPAPAVIAPPAPAPPPLAVQAVAGPKRAAIGVACPTQVVPEMPRRALQDGTEGVVRAQILIKNGAVQEVTILSGPNVFHAAVKKAIAQYKCVSDGPEVLATQEFSFKLE